MNVFRDADAAHRPELRLDGWIDGNDTATQNLAGTFFRSNYHETSQGGWLYIEDDVERYSPDREVILQLYRRAAALRTAHSA